MTKVTSRYFLFTCLLVAGLISCVEEIPLDTRGGEKKLVIEGQITNQPTSYEVRVNRSGDFAESDFAIAEPQTGAIVKIFSESNQMAVLNEVKPGVYQTNEIMGVINESYYVEVTTREGNTYQSRPEKLLPVTSIDNLSYASVVEEEINDAGNLATKYYVKVFADTQVPSDPENVYFKWDLSGVYEYTELLELIGAKVCYIPDNININNIAIFNGEAVPGQPLFNQDILTREVGFQFGSRYCFHVYQQSLTREAHQYWENVKSLKEISGGLFDVPPGKIKGNITNINDPSEEVLGYFYASAVDSSRMFLSPLALEGSYNQCYNPPDEPPSSCFNCLLLPNSTLTRPDYWQ